MTTLSTAYADLDAALDAAIAAVRERQQALTGQEPTPEPRPMAKSFGQSRASEFQTLRGEIMQSIARARVERDADTRIELCQMRQQLESQARAAGLRLDHAMRFVPV